MSYKDQYDDAKKKGKTEQVTTNIHTWEEEGEKIIGLVYGIEPFVEGQFETEVNKYIIDTDDGFVSTVLGSSTDKQIAKKVAKGNVVCITFEGKKHLKDGKSVNLFNIEVLK